MKHDDKTSLESIVRQVYNCDRGEAMCAAESDFLGSMPLAAALVTLVPLYKEHGNIEEISKFIDDYACANEEEWKDDKFVRKYIKQLKKLVDKYCLK